MNFDPEACLRSWALDVDIAGATYTIPALPASGWLMAVASGSYLDIVPGLLEGPGEALDDLLLDGDPDGLCQAAARAAIGAASGTSWWTATRLARAISTTWIGGEFTLQGVDADRVPFGAYLAAAYRLVSRRLDDQQRARLDMELAAPPTGVAPEEWFDEGAAAAGFEAAMAAQSG